MIARLHLPGALLALGLALAGCSRSGAAPPASPSPADQGLTGRWQGTATDSSGPGRMTWQLTQSGGSVTGTLTMVDTATGLGGRGAVSGTVSGSTLRFTLTIAGGGFDPPHESCTSEVAGEAQVSGDSLTGTYSGTSSCAGAIASGQVSLTRS